MSYPQQVPPGWTKGEPVKALGIGPRYAVERDWPLGAKVPHDEIAIEFDSREDCVAWLKWWQVKFEDVQVLRGLLSDVLALDAPWPLLDVLAKSAEAVEHLLAHHGCDAHGHENYRMAATVLRALIPRVERACAALATAN